MSASSIPEPDSSLLVLQGIERTYRLHSDQPVPVLRGVDLCIERGEFVALMGPSGSGKSTLLNIIACLDVPDGGTYHINNQLVSQLNDNDLAALRSREIGFVFQSFHLLPQVSVVDNVALPLFYQGVARKTRRQQAQAALERVGLGHRFHHKPAELSGGEQQRVAIARALVAKPSVLMADEPTGALDSKTGKAIMDLLLELHHDGLTIVMVTHDSKVASLASRQVNMRDGVLVDGLFGADDSSGVDVNDVEASDADENHQGEALS